MLVVFCDLFFSLFEVFVEGFDEMLFVVLVEFSVDLVDLVEFDFWVVMLWVNEVFEMVDDDCDWLLELGWFIVVICGVGVGVGGVLFVVVVLMMVSVIKLMVFFYFEEICI